MAQQRRVTTCTSLKACRKQRQRLEYDINSDVPFDLTNSLEPGWPQLTELSFPSGEVQSERLAKCWQSNYHEAAIFLEEGENNDKLDFHPCSREALPAYLVVHNVLFYCLDLLSATVLMALALMEPPAVPGLGVPVALHVSVEILALSVVAVELCMKLRWMGLKPFFTHKRTVFKLSILLLMLLEAMVVAARQATHFRILRALRPIFLIDNHYLGGVRRLTRQILQSLPPVFDMLVILFFFMTLFAILGEYHMYICTHCGCVFMACNQCMTWNTQVSLKRFYCMTFVLDSSALLHPH